MNKSELLKTISGALNKGKVSELSCQAADGGISAADLLDLTFYPRQEVAFRAAWILDCLVLTYPECFAPLVSRFLERYSDQSNRSCQRHFTKIMMCLTASKCPDKFQIPVGYNQESIIESTFEWLIDPATPVAVRVNSMDILFNLSYTTPWIAAELALQVDFLLQSGGAAVQSRGKAIAKKLMKREQSERPALQHPYNGLNCDRD